MPTSTLASLNITLPSPPVAAGNYLPVRRVGNILHLAGALPVRGDGQIITGQAGTDRTVEEAREAARWCALNLLATVQATLGSLDHVRQIVTVTGFVNAAPGFADHPAVLNGASDLLVEIFGPAGRHARAAVGVSSLPKNALVEVQMSVEVFE